MPRYATLVTLAALAGIPHFASGAEPQLSHAVYFQLKESTQANKERLVAACRNYLSGHDGTVYFAAGVLAEDFSRDVNDKDFDVSLIVVFRNKGVHDRYQTHPRHLKFIEEHQELWSGVRVFDSLIPVPHVKDVAVRDVADTRITLPDPAAFFSGLIRGKIVRKTDRGIVVKVDAVPRQWKQSRAKDANAMIGKPVHVISGENENARRLIRILHAGEAVTLDVANKKGEELTILELTEEQRQRVK